ncbi:GntR family transcriptional regulator [Mesorhizobium sp. B2-3-4]|uniref:GntR family transcriptional regulator n=1 Tax=Mesorhizobium sp. B2-3-4 TaxID=2589959 RepID=UPI00112DF89A|nr:GntR family transcriptional regulator [Mesorhizobium sp. B2-3-4]TPM40166.1 GntR family transcriptional regulator [Mesorhizobium sp. B2-3-4]
MQMARRKTKDVSGDTFSSLENEISMALRAAIVDGEIEPGTRLIELDLAARFNVSQGTIRAALKELQAQGLIVYKPRRGNFVITVEKTDVYEISMLRDSLEALGARLAAKRMDDSGRKILNDILKAMRTAAESGNRKKLMELDFEFHRTVIGISGHRRLMEIYERLEGQTRMFLRLTDRFYENLQDIPNLHEPLVAAIVNGDAETAFQLAIRHADADAEELVSSMLATNA